MRQYEVVYNSRTSDYMVIFKDYDDHCWSVQQDGLDKDFAESYVEGQRALEREAQR